MYVLISFMADAVFIQIIIMLLPLPVRKAKHFDFMVKPYIILCKFDDLIIF